VKLGTENKFEMLVAIVLGIGALASVGYQVLSSGTSPSSSPATAQRVAANRALINPLDPTIRTDLLDSTQNVKYEGKGRNIFRIGALAELPKPKVPPLADKGKQPPIPPPVYTPPAPPPIDLKFFGVASRVGEQSRIFLSRGDSVFVAREGDIVDSRFKVVKINPQSVEIEDLLNNNRQSIPLTQG
jgi:hypothetical protein